MRSLSRYEIIGIGASLLILIAVLAGIRYLPPLFEKGPSGDDVIIVDSLLPNQEIALAQALSAGSNAAGNITKLIVDDVVVGTTTEKTVRTGDTITVNYVGEVKDGKEFDNTFKTGEPLTFVVGGGEMIAGFERGVVGMREGGIRVLVVPAQLAYGAEKVGRILPNSSLVFLVELVSIQ